MALPRGRSTCSLEGNGLFRRLLLALSVILIAVLYFFVLDSATRYAAKLGAPTWWFDRFSSVLYAAFVWRCLLRAGAVLLSSLPFAVLILRVELKNRTLVTLLMCAAITVAARLGLVLMFGNFDWMLRLDVLLDCLEWALVLPALIFVAQRLPSNYRLERP
jgi:hypothetical protein